jgi:hypothetical protein
VRLEGKHTGPVGRKIVQHIFRRVGGTAKACLTCIVEHMITL